MNDERRSPWPLGIALSLMFVILVNVVFVYVAVHHADPVVPTYRTEPR